MKNIITLFFVVLIAVRMQATGFQERFALADDREAVLAELLPGSDDFFYYKALNYLNQGDFRQFKNTMEAWHRERKHGWPDSRARELLNREALLKYPADQQGTLKYLRDELNLHFNHSRKDAARARSLPTEFDNRSIDTGNLLQAALRQHPHDVNRVEPDGNFLLESVKLSADQRLDLLKRLKRPDFKGVTSLILADLQERKGASFGSLEIHSLLTLAQMDEMAKQRPDLWRSETFVNAYVARLVPIDEVDLTRELDERDAYYARVWAVIRNLIPDFNSRKANLLYNWLQNDLKRGRVKKENFLEYIKYPRVMHYAPKLSNQQRPYVLNFSKNYDGKLLPPIINEEPLVRKILLMLLKDADGYGEFEQCFRTEYIREVYAEAKVTSGQGKPEEWVPWMSRSRYDALKRRVDIDLADDNPVTMGSDDPVMLSAYIKNVKDLIVKVYEINTLNCYRETSKPIDLAMNLNGLTATSEQHFQYKEPELIRIKREFKFPELKGRGVYIIELIGNGKSSRALVQKGHLKVVEEKTAGGHAFTIFDERNNPVKDCSGWFNGSEFKPQKDGRIYLPYDTGDMNDPFSSGSARLIVCAGKFAWLVSFDHFEEHYQLESRFFVDREALIAGELAEVILRPRLRLNDCILPFTLLKQPKLTIKSTDADGVESESTISDVKLSQDADFIHQFRVPDRCRRLEFSLNAKVENMAQNKEEDLNDSMAFDLNASERGKSVNHLFLSPHQGEYTLEVRGKNGEPVEDIAVNLYFKHKFFTKEIAADLKSDKSGEIHLGALKEIARFRATWDGVGGRQCSWTLDNTGVRWESHLHGSVGETLTLPVAKKINIDGEISLLELRDGQYVKDWHSALSCENGVLNIKGLPAGDFRLSANSETFNIAITDAKRYRSHLVSERRSLETPGLKPLLVSSVERVGDNLKVQLSNVTKYARVHLSAVRYMPEMQMFNCLRFTAPSYYSDQMFPFPGCYYKSGRDIGDEYRYILERQHAKRYPGNMLERPGLLIVPWQKGDSYADKESLGRGNTFGSAADKGELMSSYKQSSRDGSHGGMIGNAAGSCDFLKNSSVILCNLKPDKEGVVTIPLAGLKGKPYLRIAAVDPENLIVKEFTLSKTPVGTRELRLTKSLAVAGGFAEKQKTTELKSGDVFEIKGAASAKFEIYDSVADLYSLFTALNGVATLKKFAFITEWNKLDDARKRELYTEFACHELNLFLYFKDPEFFKTVVKSFVANKRDKRFIDDWLLGGDLSHYCSGLSYANLNAAERALLAQRVVQKKSLIARDVREQVELLPIDQERINRLFNTALQGQALVADESGKGWSADRKDAIALKKAEKAKPKLEGALRMRGATEMKLDARREPKPKMAAAAAAPMVMDEAVELEEVDTDTFMETSDLGEDPFASRGLDVRKAQRRLFQKLESTKEWAENNYYKLSIEQQNSDLIKPNPFWQEYAEHKGERGFVSGKVIEAANSFAEMMLALAVMDLPFEAKEHKETREDGSYKLTAASSAVVFHRQVQEGVRADQGQALVAQRFFRLDDRYRHEGNERYDKIVTKEFLKRVVYGAQVVLTNPTGGRLKLRLLLQIPQGSIPVLNGFYTKGFYVTLEPYATYKQEYFFYFPESGKYSHYPVTVARNEQVTGQAEPFVFNVVDRLTDVDKESWAWISQNGSSDDVMTYLQQKNIHRVDLDEIAWRMKDKAYFAEVTELLADCGVYNETLWSYSVQHNQPERISEYLERHQFALRCGLYLDSKLLQLDPVDRNFYEHLEYAPLVNPRAHKVGKEHKIMNQKFRANYDRFMKVLSYKAPLTDEDKLATAWAMSLQDRVGEAISWFAKVDRKNIAEQVQYDYLDAYLAFYQSDVKRAESIASGYEKYHVDRWRNKFALVLAQVKEIQGEAELTAADRRSRDQAQAALAATEPALEMKVESGIIKLKGANIKGCTLNFYPMDIELLFSRSPFVGAGGANFSSVRPAFTQQVAIRDDSAWVETKLPQQFASKNVMIEAAAAGVHRSQVYYANTLDVQMVERYGHLTVRHAETGKPLPAVYVKVYAKIGRKDKFFKDGYTDLRGRFDYVSLNSKDIERVEKFSVLIMSDDLGAVVREVPPPRDAGKILGTPDSSSTSQGFEF